MIEVKAIILLKRYMLNEQITTKKLYYIKYVTVICMSADSVIRTFFNYRFIKQMKNTFQNDT